MQPQTPQLGQPAPQLPPVAPPNPPAPTPPAPQPPQEGQAFYNPQTPPQYVAPAAPPAPTSPPAASSGQSISWEASEYLHTDKGALWLIVFGSIVTVFLGVAIWLSAWTFAVLILVMAVAMAIFAFRPPRTIRYTLDDHAIKIGEQTFTYDSFKAFGIMQDGAFFTMTLIPIKRFSPAVSMYFSEDHGEQIVDIVSAHLPMQHLEPDIIDNIMRRLHF